MSTSELSELPKTDEQEIMWKKLSTPPLKKFVFHDCGRRGGFKPGELIVFASGQWETRKP